MSQSIINITRIGALKRSPIQSIIQCVENYDDIVAQYDKILDIDQDAAHTYIKTMFKTKDADIRSKDADIRSKDAVIRSKEEIIIEIKEKADAISSLIKEKDIRLKEKENQILGIKGLLTSRGIFKNYLDFCLSELKDAKLASPNQKFNVGYIISTMTKEKHSLPKDGVCAKVLNAAADCNADLKSVYSTLCRDVHGAPWNGPSLKVYLNEMKECEQCIVLFIAESMLLKVQ